MKLLGTFDVAELGGKVAELLGAHAVKDDSTKIRVPDNYTNRIVLGMPLEAIKNNRQIVYEENLYDYQIEDVQKMINCTGFLNRNKPGWGKTIEAIVAAKNLNARRILVIAPASTLRQWQVQFDKWWPERASDVKIVQSKDTSLPGDICIVNPEKVVSAKFRNKFTSCIWDVLIVDEAHILKNRKSLRTKVIKTIPARFRWAMTGTPILRHVDDLWSILDFLNPQYAGGSYWNFVRYYCEVETTYFGEQIKGLTTNSAHVATLFNILSSISCYHAKRKTKHGKTSIPVTLTMEKQQAKLYSNVRKLVLSELPDEMTIANGAVLVTRLLQVTSAPSMFDPKITGVKFEWILDFLENNPDEKVVIYSRFERALSRLGDFLTKNGVRWVTFTGKVDRKLREKYKQDFIHDESLHVMLGTIQALGVGVDELQKAAHICIFIDKDFLPDINNQCEDRLNRDGQSEEVICYYLDCEKTWDLHVTKTNEMRMSDIRRLLQEEE